MTSNYDSCAAQLMDAGLCRAAEKETHFFRHTTGNTAFILNLYPEDAGVRVVYGFTSTAFFSMGQGERLHFERFGIDDENCTLRHTLSITNDQEAAAAADTIGGFFRQYRNADKDALLTAAKERRKVLIGQIAAHLKPLGFKKKANTWHRPIAEGFILEFHAQKSDFSDQYYLNVTIRSAADPKAPGCFHTRVTENGVSLFDWQLIPTRQMDQILTDAIETILLPIIRADRSTLIEQGYIRRNCNWNGRLCRPCPVLGGTPTDDAITIAHARIQDRQTIRKYDSHIPEIRLAECITYQKVFVLLKGEGIIGVLRWSLFWQTIPFLDLLYIDDAHQGRGYGRRMMAHWENAMAQQGYQSVMLSTQADEPAKYFYEKLGYQKIGAFRPPEQDADELMYRKDLR